MLGASVDEVNEPGAAIELGKENGGVGLGFGVFDPLKAGSNGAAVAAAFPKDSATITTQPHVWVSCLGEKRLVGKLICRSGKRRNCLKFVRDFEGGRWLEWRWGWWDGIL